MAKAVTSQSLCIAITLLSSLWMVEDEIQYELHLAAKRGDLAVVARQIGAGGNPNTLNDRRLSPLYYATWFKRLDVVKYLLQNGADPNVQLQGGQTAPLPRAVANGDLAAVDLLIRHKADVNVRVAKRKTPLMIAAFLSDYSSLGLLLKSGAMPNLADDRGLTALHFVTDRRCAVNLIDRGANVEARAIDGQRPIHVVAESGALDVVNVLIQRGTQVNAIDKEKRTPLIAAIDGATLVSERKYEQVCRSLLLAGADARRRDIRGRTALALASKKKLKSISNLLGQQVKARSSIHK